MNRLISLVVLLASFGCKSTETAKASDVKVEDTQAEPHASSPMSCLITAEILRIVESPEAEVGSVCHDHPCRAIVKLLSISDCGSSFSMTVTDSDTLDIKFAYSLDATEKLFPTMKARYPGLRRGFIFKARVEQRLRSGSLGELVVYGYQIQ
jgi:hypothetical protein